MTTQKNPNLLQLLDKGEYVDDNGWSLKHTIAKDGTQTVIEFIDQDDYYSLEEWVLLPNGLLIAREYIDIVDDKRSNACSKVTLGYHYDREWGDNDARKVFSISLNADGLDKNSTTEVHLEYDSDIDSDEDTGVPLPLFPDLMKLFAQEQKWVEDKMKYKL